MRPVRRWLTIPTRLALVLALVLLAGACRTTSEGGEEFVPPSSSAPVTTTAAPPTSPTTAAPSTLLPTTAAPSTVAPTSAVKPALELRPDGLGAVSFGTPMADTVAVVGAAYGTAEPTPSDCPQYTALRWGGLTAVFYQGAFLAWVVDADTLPPLTTERTVGYGSTIAEVRARYPEVVVEPSQMGDGSFSTASFAGAADEGPYKMWAEFSGNADTDTVVMINAWDMSADPPCGRS